MACCCLALGILAGCGQSQTAQTEQAAAEDSVPGSYEAYAIGDSTAFYPVKDYLDLAKNLSSYADIAADSVRLEIKEDGTAVMSMAGEDADCTWTYEDGIFTLKAATINITGTYKNGLLTLADTKTGEQQMIFAKEGADTSGIELHDISEVLGMQE